MIVSSPSEESANVSRVVLKPQKSSHLRTLNLGVEGVDICGLVLFTSVEPRLDVHVLYRQLDEKRGIVLTYDTLPRLGYSAFIGGESQIAPGCCWMSVFSMGRVAFASLVRPRDCVLSVFNGDYHKEFAVSCTLGLVTGDSINCRTDIHALFRRCSVVSAVYKQVCKTEDREDTTVRFKAVGARAAPAFALRLGHVDAAHVCELAMNISMAMRHGHSAYTQREERGVYRLVYLNPRSRAYVKHADHVIGGAAHSMSGAGTRVHMRSDDRFSDQHDARGVPREEGWLIHDDVDAVYQLVVSGPSYSVLSEPQVGTISYRLDLHSPLPAGTEFLIHKRGLAFLARD